MAEYGVGGVPHFVFMDGNNEPLAAAVGRLPRKVLEGAWDAMVVGWLGVQVLCLCATDVCPTPLRPGRVTLHSGWCSCLSPLFVAAMLRLQATCLRWQRAKSCPS